MGKLSLDYLRKITAGEGAVSILNTPNKSVRWLLAELTVLVVGILIAISVDAWRQDLQDRETEQVLLKALAVEFTNNEEMQIQAGIKQSLEQ